MGGKFLVSGDPFLFQELQNSRVLSLQGLHRGEQVVKYLLHNINIFVHIPLLSKPTIGCKKTSRRRISVWRGHSCPRTPSANKSNSAASFNGVGWPGAPNCR